MKQWITILITLVSFLCFSEAHSQTTYYVKPGASGTGAGWSNASGDIQAMINGASAGDEVWVAAGTYKPTGMSGATGTLTARDVSYVLKSGVKVYGGFAGTETQLSQRNVKNNVTILSGDVGATGNTADNAHHVVVSVKNTGETVLDGFTISDGNANAAGTVAIDGINVIRYAGGAIYTYLSTATFRNVIIEKNHCEGGDDYFGNGGAIYSGLSELTIEDAVISENDAARAPGKNGGTSGAIFFFGSASVKAKLVLTRVKLEKNVSANTVGAVTVSSYSDAEFTDVDFIENKTTGTAGALRIAGADADNFTNFKMKGGSFVKNTATTAGGAVYAFTFSNYHFEDVLFSENQSTASAGGALFLFSGDAVAVNKDVLFSNCVFYKNESRIEGSLGGGAIFLSNNTQIAISGCTFYENDARFNGGAIGTFGSATVKLDISNSIFYRNTSAGADKDFYVGALSILELVNTITQGQGTNGVNGVKIDVDPQFSSTDLSNPHFMRLLAASPAVDAGINDKIPAGVIKDKAGNDRIVNGTVDMGAYEFKDEGGPTLNQAITFAAGISKKYGDVKFSPATASSGLPVSYSSSNTDVAVVEDGQLVIKGVGTTQITAGQPGDYQYLPAVDVIQTLTVTKAILKAQPADTSMIQGDPLPEFRIIYTGFGYDETIDVLTLQPVVSTPATPTSAAGEYTLTASGAAAANYTIEYETGKLTIVTEYEEGKIRYVKPVASGTGSGLSWDNASADLQAMIDAASAGGEVWVAKGTYKPTALPGSSGTLGSRDVAFVLKSGVGVYGGFAGNEVRRSSRSVASNETILSGDVGVSGTNTDNAYHVVISVSNTAGTILDGFTITNGLAGGTGSYSIGGVVINKNAGAGVYVSQSQDVLFENLTITRNNAISAGIGGGIYVAGSMVTFRNSVISENVTAGGSAGRGAGFYLIGESGAINETKFINVAIRNNSSIGTGGAGYIGSYSITEFEDSDIEDNTGSEGAGIHSGAGVAGFKVQIKATRTNFRRNVGLATGNGGAMLVASYNELELYDCEFTGNVAGYQGGAIYINGNQTSFTRFIVDGCRFAENKLLQASGNGGALRINFFVDAWVRNSTFHDNEASGGGAISFVGSSDSPTKNYYLINNVFYNNKSTGATSGGGAVSTSNYMTANIINCTFYNNEAVNEGGGVRILRSRTLTMNIYNSIFNKNKALTGSDLTYPDYPTIDFKNNYTQETGTNGVDGMIVGSNPEFESTDPANEKFLRLSILSEAFNKGDNTYLPSDITTDKDGKDRIIYGIVDMGAYEYDGPPLNPTTQQTITFSGDINKTYGDANFDPGATASSGLAVRYTSSNTSVAVVTGDNKIQLIGGGTAQITANQTGNAVYFPADPVSVTLTVAKAPLIVKPTDTNVELGAEFPQFTATYTGLVNGDTESSISTPPLITTTASETSPLGTYPLTASGAQSNKYEFTYEPGTLTIVTPVWIPAEKVKVEAWFSSSTQMQVHVDMITEQNASLVLYTNVGVPVYQMNVTLHPGTNKFVIPVDRLVSGVYIINVKGSGLKFEKKIIKR